MLMGATRLPWFGVAAAQVKDPFEAQYIKVIPAEHRGAGELCPLQRNPDVRDRAGRPQLWFSFQRRKFEYDADERKVRQCRL